MIFKSASTFYLVILVLSAVVLESFGHPGSGGGRSGGNGAGGRSSVKGFLGLSGKPSSKQAVGTQLNAGGGSSVGPRIARAGGSLLSAWGIISLILFIIVGSALTYYISIFYPLICAKQGKYDVMEMTAV